MKRFSPYLIGALITLFVLAAFSLGQASAAVLAASSCFSDTSGHWAEAAICWAASKGVVGGYPDGTFKPNNNVTRAQVAVMIKNQATVGTHYFNVGPNAWAVNGTSGTSAYVEPYTMQAHLRRSAAGSAYFQVTPTLPATLYSSTTRFTGVQFCYKTEDATIDQVEILHSKYYGGAGATAVLESYTDPTDRTDYACRVYSLADPSTYYPDNTLSFMVDVYFPSSAAYVRVFSTTFILEATDYGPGLIYSMEMPGLPQMPDSEQILIGPESGE